MGVSEDGTDCRFYLDTGITAQAIDTFTIGDETYLIAVGKCRGNRRARRNGCAVSFNLTTGERSTVQNLGRGRGANSLSRCLHPPHGEHKSFPLPTTTTSATNLSP